MERPRTEIAIQPPGYAVLWISAGLSIIGLFVLSAGFLFIGVFGLIFLSACRYLATRHLNGIEISRPLPARAFVGRSFPIESILTNPQSRLTAVDFRIEDSLSSSKLYVTLSIAPRGSQVYRYPGKCLRRGLIRQEGWSLRSTYPLGLFESSRRGKFKERSTILALPRPYLHQRLRDHLEQQERRNLQSAHLLPGSDDEFRLLREFRPGDPIRAIHWPSSLRAAQLQVRQTEPPKPKPPRTSLVLHAYHPPGKLATPETFELILRIAAGLLLRFRDSEAEIDFHILPQPPLRLCRRAEFDDALETLALLQRKPIRNLSVALSGVDRLERCYILGDSPLRDWEPEALAVIPNAVCIDTTDLGSHPLAMPAMRGSAS